MHKFIIIRDMEGHYMTSLPHNPTVVKTWFRENSPLPSYPKYAEKFTLEFGSAGDHVSTFRKPAENTSSFSYATYIEKFAPKE